MLSAIWGGLQAAGAFFLTPAGIASGLGTIVLAYILKKIDNSFVYVPIYTLFKIPGVLLSGAMNKWKPTRVLWEKMIEPYIIDLFDNIMSAIKDGFNDGLRSDNL